MSELKIKDLRQAIVDRALSQLGKPYVQDLHFDSAQENQLHFDCSSLAQWAYFHGGQIKLPRTAHEQFLTATPTQIVNPGDLAFFAKPSEKSADNPYGVYHVGIVVDDENIVEARAYDEHASFQTGCVITRPLIKWVRWDFFSGFRIHPALKLAAA